MRVRATSYACALIFTTVARRPWQVFAAAGDCFRSSLPSGGTLFSFQVAALRLMLAAADGPRDAGVLAHDFGDLMQCTLRHRCVRALAACVFADLNAEMPGRHSTARHIKGAPAAATACTTCRWVDHLCMLQLLGLLAGEHRASFRAPPLSGVLPTWAPLLLKVRGCNVVAVWSMRWMRR